MKEFILKKDDFENFIERLTLDSTVYAPVNEDEVLTFKPVDNSEGIAIEYQNSVVPPKKILFPQTETLFSYQLGESPEIEEARQEKGDTIIFGIRPCDGKSFQILDKVFGGRFSDVYYLRKREKTTLIGLACEKPCVNCFCTSLGGDPANREGLDLLLTVSEDDYFIDVLTDRGSTIVEQTQDVLQEVSDVQRQAKETLHENSAKKIQRSIDVEGIPKKLNNLFYHKIWNDLARLCVGCSICTFLCPTCHCFDIQDETFGTEGERIRVWDTCSNPEYTLHASGHNPRPGRMHRTRNRIYHKYNYFPQNFGEIACVGCGRCIEKCPVNIDILDMLAVINNQ